MKIVKEKVEVSHDTIIKEAIQRASKRFTAEKELIEECIESMLEKDYIAKTIR